MNPLIEQHLDAIRALAREYGVARLEGFGSAATDAFDPNRSDVDFIVEYPEGYDFGIWLTRYSAEAPGWAGWRRGPGLSSGRCSRLRLAAPGRVSRSGASC